MSARTSNRPARPWYVDGATAFAFFVTAYFLGRALRGVLPAAIFLFLINAGAGWFFARAAWRGLMRARR